MDPVLDHATAAGATFEVVPCDPDLADTAAFCEAYGYEMGDSANAIIVAGKADPAPVAMCLLLATTKLDVNKVVRKRLGTRKASFATAEQTVELTGMQIGGVTPFGAPLGADLPLWVDARVLTRERVIVGGGSRDRKLLVDPEVFSRMEAVEVVDGLALDAS